MNSIVLSGRLVRDPELRHSQSGTAVCSMRIAVDRAGMKQDDGSFSAGYFDVSAFGNQAENAARYLEKGSRLAVQGELRHREWEAKDGGGKRSASEVNAFRVEFLDTKADRESRGELGAQPEATDEYRPSGDFATPDPPDDDIPF